MQFAHVISYSVPNTQRQLSSLSAIGGQFGRDCCPNFLLWTISSADSPTPRGAKSYRCWIALDIPVSFFGWVRESIAVCGENDLRSRALGPSARVLSLQFSATRNCRTQGNPRKN